VNRPVPPASFVWQIAPTAARGELAMCCAETDAKASRRMVLQWAGALLVAAPAANAMAAMYDYGVKGSVSSVPKDGSVSQYLPQIKAGYQALIDLQNDWENYTKDFDGDKVRRILGTVGVKSPLFNIKKAFEGAWNALKSADIDVDILEEAQEDFDEVLNEISQVDFQLYSVNFTELRPTKQNLVDQGKATLDKMLLRYKDFIEKLEANM